VDKTDNLVVKGTKATQLAFSHSPSFEVVRMIADSVPRLVEHPTLFGTEAVPKPKAEGPKPPAVNTPKALVSPALADPDPVFGPQQDFSRQIAVAQHPSVLH
jgi:hypothetical protein